MKCEYSYCIYNRKSTCILDEIQMDSLGMCNAYEVTTADINLCKAKNNALGMYDAHEIATVLKNLEKYKKQHLEKIKALWKDYNK